jgi:hypothetical protein
MQINCLKTLSNGMDSHETHDCPGGEIEIEKVPVQEIEIREKDLLPVFDHFHGFQSDQSFGKGVLGRYASASSFDDRNMKRLPQGKKYF